MFHIVLVAPQIAPNTGNVIRLAANTGCTLHLIAPLGFALDDRRMRRAGLDYHEWQPVQVHDSLAQALAACGEVPQVFVIGGAQLYAQALACADTVIATEVKAVVAGDAFFPALPVAEWHEVSRTAQPTERGYDYDFVVYRRANGVKA